MIKILILIQGKAHTKVRSVRLRTFQWSLVYTCVCVCVCVCVFIDMNDLQVQNVNGLFVWVLLHIKPCWLFNAKYILNE